MATTLSRGMMSVLSIHNEVSPCINVLGFLHVFFNLDLALVRDTLPLLFARDTISYWYSWVMCLCRHGEGGESM